MSETNKTAVVLLSGGLDSAPTLAMARREGFACHALSFDYGLRPADGSSSTNTSARGVSTSPIPQWNVVENARFKSDIDLNMPGGRAFVGVRLVLPIGD